MEKLEQAVEAIQQSKTGGSMHCNPDAVLQFVRASIFTPSELRLYVEN